jgi:predicted dehydrogenase
MNTSSDIHRAVAATLASKRLGTPVFVRYLFHAQAHAGNVLPRLAHVVEVLREWFGQPLERLYALGSVTARHITLTLEFRGSGTALVSWAGSGGSGLDLTVLGNHGALYHDVGAGNLWEPLEAGAEPAVDKDLASLIERALQSGRPEAGGKP